MAKETFCCRLCRTELEPIALADGTAALVCIGCDLIGLASEVREGAPMRPAGLCEASPRRKPLVPRMPRRRAAAA